MTLRPGILEAIDLLRNLPGKAREQPEESKTKETTNSAQEDFIQQAALSGLEGVMWSENKEKKEIEQGF